MAGAHTGILDQVNGVEGRESARGGTDTGFAQEPRAGEVSCMRSEYKHSPRSVMRSLRTEFKL